MKSYIGSKIIKAVKMTDLEFEEERRLFQSADNTAKAYKRGENLLRTGVNLCESSERLREPKDGYKVMYPDGYLSWSPKSAFETAYREVTQAERELI